MNWILGLYLWTFEWANYEHFIIRPYHIGGRSVLWYFYYMPKERETLDETLMTLKNIWNKSI
jgi:hypothetical protein